MKSEIDQREADLLQQLKDAEKYGKDADAELATLRTQLKSVEADAAVMRGELLKLKITEHTKSPCDEYDSHYAHLCPVCKGIDKALATNAGKAYQARMEEAEWLIEQIKVCNSSSWLKRRDAFLNPTNKDVM